MEFKMPPIEKIYEAYSALADNRVKMNEEEALVDSSNHSKTYIVTFKDGVYTSSDNSSYWQGYLGYPILSVLMLQGKLSLNREICENFKGINWKELNTQYKNNYKMVLDYLLKDLESKGVDINKINKEVNKVYEEIKSLDIILKRGKVFPPK